MTDWDPERATAATDTEGDSRWAQDDIAIHHAPWRPTLDYACHLMIALVVFPLICQIVYMVIASRGEFVRAHVELPNITSVSEMRVKQNWFNIWGVLFGCGIALLYFSCGLLREGGNGKYSQAVQGLIQDAAAVFCVCPNREANDSCLTRTGCCIFVLLATIAPAAAWYGPFTWWGEAAAQYRVCHRVCAQEQLASLAPHGIEACESHMWLTPAKVPKAKVDDRLDEKDTNLCVSILDNTKMSAYTRRLLVKGHTFLAFESSLRRHFVVSALDIFGAPLGLLLFALVLGARAALREQNRTLQRLRVRLLEDLSADEKEKDKLSDEKIDKWIEFFRLLDMEDDTGKKSWTSKQLEAIKAKKEEKNREPVKEEKERLCSSVADIFQTVLAVFWALVDSSFPLVYRWGSGQPLLVVSADNPEVLKGFWAVSLASIVLTFIGGLSSFYLLSIAYFRHQSQINNVINFDCLFRFPFEHPQTTVLMADGRDQKTLRKELRHRRMSAGSPSGTTTPRHFFGDISERQPEKDPLLQNNNGQPSSVGSPSRATSVVSDDNSDYFAVFLTLKDVNDNRAKLEYYFCGRQYLLVDKVDERNSLETAIVVGLLALVPRSIIVVCNLWMETGFRRFVQPANLAFVWRFSYILVLCLRSLMETMNLNDRFGAHIKRLKKLRDYCRFTSALEGNGVDIEAAKIMDNLADMMVRLDLPSTLFGFKVGWGMLATFVGISSISLPQLAVVCMGLVDYLAL